MAKSDTITQLKESGERFRESEMERERKRGTGRSYMSFTMSTNVIKYMNSESVDVCERGEREREKKKQ